MTVQPQLDSKHLLDDYLKRVSGYDEMMKADGRIRPHWRSVVEAFSNYSGEARIQIQDSERRMLRDHDFTHGPWHDVENSRAKDLDVFPVVMNNREWSEIVRGLHQRARLLNAIVADIYGPQELLKSNALPPASIYANPNFLRACHGYTPPDGIYLKMLAFDLVRGPDGRWWVLSQNTETPSGAGYALENRIVTSRCLPGLYESLNCHRLAGFFRDYADYLSNQNTEILAVVMSPGPNHKEYFEHAFLARYLGYPLVEGADLTVRDNNVYLMTLEGLKRVHLIMRQVPADLCDPLELRTDSTSGTAGLLRALKTGQVVVSNVPGSGVAESPLLNRFLPQLSEQLLGETLELPSPATWWCGYRAEYEQAVSLPGSQQLRHAFLPFERLPDNLEEAHALLAERPHLYVAQEYVQPSTVPVWQGHDSLTPGPMKLRVYVAATKNGYVTMPGGLVEIDGISTNERITKDLWVPSDGEVEKATLLPSRNHIPIIKRSDRDLPSKTADDLFWFGRYLERAVGSIWLYRSLFHHLIGETGTEEFVALDVLTGLLVSQNRLTSRRAKKALAGGYSAVEQELRTVLFDPDSSESLLQILGHVQRTAEHIRERLSLDAWRTIESLTRVPAQRSQIHNAADLISILNEMIMAHSAMSGLIHENMTRGYGWRLMDLGRRIERVRHQIRILQELCLGQVVDAPGSLNLLLELLDSTITYKARYRSVPQFPAVLDLILADTTNPRSVLFQLDMMADHIAIMPQEQPDSRPSIAHKILIGARTELILAEVENLIKIPKERTSRTALAILLESLMSSIDELTAVISRTYFSHSLGRTIGQNRSVNR